MKVAFDQESRSMLRKITEQIEARLQKFADAVEAQANPDPQEKIANIEEHREVLNVLRLADTASKWFPRVDRVTRLFGRPIPQDILKALEGVAEQRVLAEKLIHAPDEFNELFAARGWIVFETLDFELVEKTLALGREEKWDEAEALLVAHYDEENLSFQLRRLQWLKAFGPRMELLTLAKNDYLHERYHASILVVLTLIDGVANEVGDVGFFARDADLTAWNSISAHPKGLVELQRVMTKSRTKTTSELLTVPFRHGILHGRDLGYANKIVASKCWATLFAIADLVSRAERGGRLAPSPDEKESTWSILRRMAKSKSQMDKLPAFEARSMTVGVDFPASGSADEYGKGTPERELAAFLENWRRARFALMLEHLFDEPTIKPKARPGLLAKGLRQLPLTAYAIESFPDDYQTRVVIRVELHVAAIVQRFDFVLNCVDRREEFTFRGLQDSRWKIRNWHSVLGQLEAALSCV